ncbi:hypothetical protein DFJ67_8449 [Asanoa ferruginea]|uniref:Uncharacterized protein n=1 Tax=Asanoa ferruginea TaxID=53367 RepID=A0A3E0A0C7_9ACTN|nr:hypothetical protein [Asanoa ferruginea]REG02355.1 hypothetical protein DFJ67_8449 [Asanoa ferruginea]GIF46590.1 hypothetical protein Afe04nite_11290 [Asanoa ferruginea]
MDILGDEPLVDGMTISLRYRRDFVVADAARLLAEARRLHRELQPGADAEAAVTCAADAIYTILQHAGIVGDAVDAELVTPGLELAGWRSQITVNEPEPLRPGYDCLRTGDLFALPPEQA